MVNIAVIGCGYWGPNYVRTFSELPSSKVSVCCDLDSNRLDYIKGMYPLVKTTTNYHDLLQDPEIDAVSVSTPASTHYEIAKESLLLGKHVLVEKPLTLSVKEGKELLSIAQKQMKVLMVGNVYLYHPAVQKVKSYLSSENIELYYLYSIRTGLGPIRRDTNALWDLAPHDISIFLYLLGQMPQNASVRGASYLQNGIEDVAVMALEFPRNIMGYIHVSWLDPYKVRKLTIVSNSKMLVFDEGNSIEPLKIFDRGVSKLEASSYGEFLLEVRGGDIYAPKIESAEPLRRMCADFVECIDKGANPISNGEVGLKTVRILEAAQRSLKNKGAPVNV